MNTQKPVNFPLRLPRSIDTELRQEANREGISINSVIVMHLARSTSRPSVSEQVKQCTDDLFCVGMSNEAKRLVIETLDGSDGGGYCREAIEAHFRSAIENANNDWSRQAEHCMNALIDSHEKLDREGLGKALQGMRILLGRQTTPKTGK